MRILKLLAAGMVPFLVVATALAAQKQEEFKLVASGGALGDSFGRSVSIFGDRALVGAAGDDDSGPSSGAAYLFARAATGGWIEEARLTAADAGPEHEFGNAVSLFGERALVGAPGADEAGFATGAAYVFERDSSGAWLQAARLVASDADAFDHFGISVALFGDRALLGAFFDEDLGAISGSAYVFERDASGLWTQTAKLVASDGDMEDGFGVSAALFGDRALLGASGDEDQGESAGSAYLFEREDDGDWIQVQKLLALDGATLDVFGAAVSLVGNRAVVGAYGDDDLGDGSGSAYVFERNSHGQWVGTAKLLASDGTEGDLFGSVSICGDRAVIGARRAEISGASSGSTYVFELNHSGAWIETSALHPSDGALDDHFGSAVSVLGDRALVGARLEDHGGAGDQGAAYVFALGAGETYCQAVANSTGAPAILSATGSASVSANELSLVALPVPRGTGIFFFGETRTQHAFGNGVLCVQGPFLRLAPVQAQDYVISQRLDFSAPPLLGNVIAGSSWYVQAVFRDVAAGRARFNTSSAIALSFLP